MNGATALPLARTMRAPNTASMRMTGSSQYFLRARMKRHSSPMKSIMLLSKLPRHGVRRRARWIALDPVGDGIPIPSKPERILAEQAAHEPDRSHGGVEDQAHDHRTDAGMEDQPTPEPDAVERREHPGKGESGQEEGGRDDQSPAAHRPPSRQRSQTKEREKNRKDQPEGPVRRASHRLVDDKSLMSFPHVPLSRPRRARPACRPAIGRSSRPLVACCVRSRRNRPR